jgi:putative transposase
MDDGKDAPVRARWARLRFAIIGSLLASPPAKGELQSRIRVLADKLWEHPVTGEPKQVSFSTIERWYYAVCDGETDPFGKLARRTRKDSGAHPTISVELGEAIAELYRDHRTWQYKLLYDNLRAIAPGGLPPARPGAGRAITPHRCRLLDARLVLCSRTLA